MHLRPLVLLVIFTCALFSQVWAQYAPSTRAAAWMGGGFSYISGPEAAVMNPANLMITDHKRMTRIQFPTGMFFLNDHNWFDTQPIQERYYSQFFTDRYPVNAAEITPANTELLMINWFGNGSTFQRDAGWDVMLFALSGKTQNRGWALFARSRGVNTSRLSRDWFDGLPDTPRESLRLDRLFHQQWFTFYEVGLGIGQEFQLINGLTGGLSRFYLGMTPKLLISNSYFEQRYESNYFANGQEWQQTGRQFVRGNPLMMRYVEPSNPTHQVFGMEQLQQFNGFGMGLDVGFNWIIPFGTEITKVGAQKHTPVKYSIRLAASMTDFGFLNFNNPIQEYSSSVDTAVVNKPIRAVSRIHAGHPSQNEAFLGQDESSSLSSANAVVYEHQGMLLGLPTRVNLGAALQLNILTLLADVSTGFNEMMYNNTHPRLSLGSELRLIPFIPVRGGVAIEQNRPVRIGMGTGLELPMLVINASLQYELNKVSEYMQPIAGAFTSIQFRF